MRQLCLIALGCTLFALSTARASAITEFCPAELHIRAVGATSKTQSNSLYGVALSALNARTATATLAFDTDAGWFTAAVPPIQLAEKHHSFVIGSHPFTRSDWVSAVTYVRFPSSVRIKNSWVSSANGQTCFPSVPAPKDEESLNTRGIRLDWADETQLGTPPDTTAVVISAQKSAPLYATTCKSPFRDGSMTATAPLQLPAYPKVPDMLSVVVVEVVINSDGSLGDAYVWGPSGDFALDSSALRAARLSKYENAIAYCQPVPSRYLFVIESSPNSDMP